MTRSSMYQDQKPSLLSWIRFPATLSAARAELETETSTASAQKNRPQSLRFNERQLLPHSPTAADHSTQSPRKPLKGPIGQARSAFEDGVARPESAKGVVNCSRLTRTFDDSSTSQIEKRT